MLARINPINPIVKERIKMKNLKIFIEVIKQLFVVTANTAIYDIEVRNRIIAPIVPD